MQCKECGIDNKDDARFCAGCGTNSVQEEQKKHSRKCPACGFGNLPEGRYCARCGARLHRHSDGHHFTQQVKQERHKKKDGRAGTMLNRHPAIVVLVLMGGAFALIAGVELFVKKQPSPPPPFVETRSGDSKLEATVMEIASKFICSCGACGEKPLEICTCNKAVEERQFIRNYLEQGQEPEQVILALNNTYNWIKPEFAALVGDSTAESVATVRSNLSKATPQEPSSFGTFTNKTTTTKLATAADRLEIFSHFRCPCGQCGIDELKDCNCNHPRGALEVKAFVDVRIADGKYTIDQMIGFVDEEYGNRKF